MRVHAIRPICHPPRLPVAPLARRSHPHVPARGRHLFFGALAAGLRPAMAPVSTHDGNMRIDSIDDVTWSAISAVLQEYLRSSRPCCRAKRNVRPIEIPLIEDAAHALETDIDEPDREFRRCFRLQLVEALPGRGGVLAFDGEVSRRDVARLRDRLMLPRPIGNRAVGLARSAARAALETLHLMQGLDRARHLTHPVRPAPWRVPLRAPRLEQARSSGDLDQFDAWMGQPTRITGCDSYQAI